MNTIKKAIFSACFFAGIAQATPKVVSSIYPLQQIANAIVGEPTGLVADSYLSPHHYTIKPKDAQKILDADLFIWVNEMIVPQLHTYVDRRLEKNKVTITAGRIPDMHLLKFSSDHHHDHEHHDHEHHDHEHHDHEHHDHEHHDHEHHDHEHHDHEHHDHEHHDHDHSKMAYDPHVWLSTYNAKVIATEIAKKLSQIDHENQARYNENLKAFIKNLDSTKKTIGAGLKNNPPKPFFIFHDAYQYFEKEFNVKHIGVVRAHAGQAPLTKHLVELKQQINTANSACLFREPQFKSPLVEQLVSNSEITVSVLDPLGYQKETLYVKDGYMRILENIAKQLETCGR